MPVVYNVQKGIKRLPAKKNVIDCWLVRLYGSLISRSEDFSIQLKDNLYKYPPKTINRS